MVAPTATAFDDEPRTAEETEGLLSAPEANQEEPPAEPPKRGRGRPPGSRNKPKLPGAPPAAPGRRPRTTARKPATKAPTTEEKIMAAWGIPVALCAVAGSTFKSEALQADSIVLDHYTAGAGKILAPLVDASPRFTALLDKLGGSSAPAVAAAMFALSLGAQFAVNHDLIPASAGAPFGAVPRDQVLGAVPAAAVQEPEPAPVPEPEQQLADPWAQGNLPPDWQ